jgi:hypothetical protein
MFSPILRLHPVLLAIRVQEVFDRLPYDIYERQPMRASRVAEAAMRVNEVRG